ncbi:MAG: hypothetical protein V1738_00735, partial [Patescibacteria group bacterium]
MPKKSIISLDATNYFQEKIGVGGISRGDLQKMGVKLCAVRKILKSALSDKSVGYLSMPEREEDIRVTIELAKKISRQFNTLIVLGIGGSDLGARMLVRALKSDRSGMNIKFLGANTDPEEISQIS